VIGGLRDGARMPTAPQVPGGRQRRLHTAGPGSQHGLLCERDRPVRRQLLHANRGRGDRFRYCPGEPVLQVSAIQPSRASASTRSCPRITSSISASGWRSQGLEYAAYINNLTDESAFPVTRSRSAGGEARVGFLTQSAPDYRRFSAEENSDGAQAHLSKGRLLQGSRPYSSRGAAPAHGVSGRRRALVSRTGDGRTLRARANNSVSFAAPHTEVVHMSIKTDRER